MFMGVVFAAVVGAPAPMYEYKTCALITNDNVGPCTELLTVAIKSNDGTDDATAALCCEVAAVHAPAKPFDTHYTKTTDMTIDGLVLVCEFIVTYAPANAAWCSTWDGWENEELAMRTTGG